MQKVKEVHVLAAGAAGGFLSWVFALTVGIPPSLPHWWQAIPATLLLGAGAAFLGVYLIAASDPAQVNRCLAFALLCGFAWKPVFDAGSALVEQSVQRQRVRTEAAQLTARSREITRQLTSPPPGTAVETAVGEAAAVATHMVDVAQSTAPVDPVAAGELALSAARTLTAAVKVAPTPQAVEQLPIEETMRVLGLCRQLAADKDPQSARRFDEAQAELSKALGASK